MNQQLVTMAVGLGLSQVARRLDLDTPDRLFGIRAIYLATNVIILALYLYIAARVSCAFIRQVAWCFHACEEQEAKCSLSGTRQVRRKNDNTILKYVEPKPFSVCFIPYDQALHTFRICQTALGAIIHILIALHISFFNVYRLKRANLLM